jgi:hypothetical protein
MIGRRGGIACVVVALATLAAPSVADAARRKEPAAPVADAAAPLGRVLAETAEVRSGAGFSYRVIAVLSRDDVVRMVERGKRGGWTRVRLESGIVGWVLSEQLLLFSAGTGEAEKVGPFKRAGRRLRETILGPPNLLTARIGGAFSAGALGKEGLFLVRPSVFLSPNAAIEGYVGPAVGREASRAMMGLGVNLYVSPGIPFSPFVSVGTGAVYSRGKVDRLGGGSWQYLVSPGAGFWLIFKAGVGIRFDFRNHVLFRADSAQQKQEYSGGLAFSF